VALRLSAIVFDQLYKEKGARWRAKALLEACGEPVPPAIEDRIPELISVIWLSRDLAPDRFVVVQASVRASVSAYTIGYAEAIRLAFKACASRDMLCGVALKLAEDLGKPAIEGEARR